MQDLINAYFEIPVRNRRNINFIAAPATAKTFVGLITNTTKPKLTISVLAKIPFWNASQCRKCCHLRKSTLAIAIGSSELIRTVVLASATFDVQPRMAVAPLRDSTALSAANFILNPQSQ